jgi:hypothetical protein
MDASPNRTAGTSPLPSGSQRPGKTAARPRLRALSRHRVQPAARARLRALWVGLYILGLLVLLEIGARITWRGIEHSWGLVVPQDISRFDDIYGWSLRPGAQSVSKTTGRPVHYDINSLGRRGPEIPYDKPAYLFRILFLGDSHTFGFGVPESQQFPTLLAGYFPAVQAVNLGVSGYGLDQELLVLTREGFKYHPNLVIAYVPHYADLRHLRDMAWGMGKPTYRLENDTLVLTNCPVTNNAWYRTAALDSDRFLSHWSRAYEMARDTVFHFVVSREKLVGAAPPSRAVLDEAQRMGEAIIDEMAAQCASHKARFLLVTRVGALSTHADAKNIPCLYIGTSLGNERLSLSNDPTRHPNEAANGIIAASMAGFMTAHGLGPRDR